MISLEFDEYTPHAQCVVALLAGLSIAERLAIKLLSPDRAASLPWDNFIARAHQVSFRSAGKMRYLDEYFRSPVANVVELNEKNPGSIERIAYLIASLIGDLYFRPGSPLRLAEESVKAEPQLRELAGKLSEFSKAKHILDVLKKTNPTRAGRDECVLRYFAGAFEGPKLSHPDFPSLYIFDLIALKTEFHGRLLVGQNSDPNWGLFAVIREARGWAAEDPKNVNLLVRDALWIFPSELRKKLGFCGFYASVVDKNAFAIQEVELDEGTVVVLAKLDTSGTRRQRCKLIFADFDYSHPFQIRNGVIAGTTGGVSEPFFAAWKALVIRPNWDELPLSALLLQCQKRDGIKVMGILTDSMAMGVLFSDPLRTRVPEVQRRREAFRAFVANDPELVPASATSLGEFVSRDLQSRLEAVVEDAYADAAFPNPFNPLPDTTAKKFINEIMEALAAHIKENWNLIDPAQIITFKKLKRTRNEAEVDAIIVSRLRHLLERQHVVPYSE
jgi:hypothetical protein